jgi:hypothetical protein
MFLDDSQVLLKNLEPVVVLGRRGDQIFAMFRLPLFIKGAGGGLLACRPEGDCCEKGEGYEHCGGSFHRKSITALSYLRANINIRIRNSLIKFDLIPFPPYF